MVTPQRLIAPYYPLLLPLMLLGIGHAEIIRRCWWRILAIGVYLLAFLVLVLSPDRPLWPAQIILSKAVAQHPNSHLLTRALNVYAVYAKRSDPLANVRALLPPDVKTIGFIGTEDDTDLSLWLPLGSRTVEHFLLSDPPELIRAKVQFAVVNGFNLKYHNVPLEDWLRENNAEVIATTTATLKVSEGEQSWYVVRFR